MDDQFKIEERLPKTFKFEKELPRAVFSRPDIPFYIKIFRHKAPLFQPIVVCIFEDYLPAYDKKLKDDVGFGYEFETITLFFPDEAEYLIPPQKLASRDKYEPFNIHDRGSLHRRFVTRFRYMSNFKNIQPRIKVSPIYQKMLEMYPKDNIEESYMLDEVKYQVRKIVADNPIVRINDKKEIIDGPF